MPTKPVGPQSGDTKQKMEVRNQIHQGVTAHRDRSVLINDSHLDRFGLILNSFRGYIPEGEHQMSWYFFFLFLRRRNRMHRALTVSYDREGPDCRQGTIGVKTILSTRQILL